MGLNLGDIADLITPTLSSIIERGRDKIQNRYKDFSSAKFVVFTDRQPTLPHYPAIEIVRQSEEESWAATRVREQVYHYILDCSVKSPKREAATEWLIKFSMAVKNWLNDFENLQHAVDGGRGVNWYDSLATGVNMDFRRALAVRTARIDWYCKIRQSLVFEGISG